MCEWWLACAQGSIAAPAARVSIESGVSVYHVSNGNREIWPAESVSAWRFEPPASAAF
jgi:hypothetical protein